jgi:predicted RNA-binding protein with PIN domain
MRADSVLLEPYYSFRLEVPPSELGRAINDVRSMNGTFSAPDGGGEMSVLTGRAPVAAIRDYAASVAAYTHGRGRFFCRPDGYEACRSTGTVSGCEGYDPEADLENTPDSVFCAHGAGFTVKWDKVPEFMHIDTGFGRSKAAPEAPLLRARSLNIDEKELEAIMDREFGPIRRPMYSARQYNSAAVPEEAPKKKEYLLVDGYNVIYAWDELAAIARDNLDLARRRLADILANYRGYTRCELVLVFDAYRVPGGAGEREDCHGILIAYTKQGETGDQYIEKLAADIGKNYSVRVVTSDNLIQLSAFRSGVLRTSAREFESEVSWVLARIDEAIVRMDENARGESIGDRVNFDGKQ